MTTPHSNIDTSQAQPSTYSSSIAPTVHEQHYTGIDEDGLNRLVVLAHFEQYVQLNQRLDDIVRLVAATATSSGSASASASADADANPGSSSSSNNTVAQILAHRWEPGPATRMVNEILAHDGQASVAELEARLSESRGCSAASQLPSDLAFQSASRPLPIISRPQATRSRRFTLRALRTTNTGTLQPRTASTTRPLPRR